MNKKTIYIIGIIAAIVGGWGVFDFVLYGDSHTGYGSFVVWGLWVALYFLFGGIATGCFMWASLDLLFEIPSFKGTGKPALWAALVNLVAGLAAIALDLGHMERFWKTIVQPNMHSGVAEDVWGYTIFGLLTVIAILLAATQPKNTVLKIVMAIGLVVSIIVAGLPGKLMGNNATRLFWHSSFLPMQFLFQSLTVGAAMLLIMRGFFFRDKSKEQSPAVLNISTVLLVLANLYCAWAYFSQAIAGNMPDIAIPAHEIVSGKYCLLFWGIQIGIGSILPIIILVGRSAVSNAALAGLMGILILLGNAVARYLVLVPGQQVELLEGLSTAFNGRGLTLSYFPSVTEWAVAFGLFGIVVLGLQLGSGMFQPLSKSQKEF